MPGEEGRVWGVAATGTPATSGGSAQALEQQPQVEQVLQYFHVLDPQRNTSCAQARLI